MRTRFKDADFSTLWFDWPAFGDWDTLDWSWPDHPGAVPGTLTRRTLTSADEISLSRVGGDRGKLFSPEGTSFSELSLPPDRLAFDRQSFVVNTSHEAITSGQVQIEESVIAPWFGQPGGGTQYRFILGRTVLTSGDLQQFGLLTRRGM
jgi:hypothetical protein